MSLREEFQDETYRRAYAESFANTIIATQIRLLRGSMNQTDFADLVGVKQSRISAMEDENYSAWSTKSLKRLATGRDVVFVGRFVSFGELLDWSRQMSKESLTVSSFADDPAFADGTLANESQIVAALSAANIRVYQVITLRPSLEEFFLRVTGEDESNDMEQVE